MNLVCQHMRVMEVNKKRELSELYTRLIFPLQGNGWDDVKWVTHCGVTFVTMWDEKHLLKNIRFSMIQDMMGLGPMKYCIVSNAMPNFARRLLLLLHYLPQKKMCFYPHLIVLDPPFNLSPWREIGEAISSGRLNLKNPLLRTIYFYPTICNFSKDGIFMDQLIGSKA